MRLLMLLFLLLTPDLLCQEINFFKENISFRLTGEGFFVEGYYWFSNATDNNREKLIFYPFGNTTNSEIIDSIGVFNLTQSTPQYISRRTKHGIYFLVSLAARDTVVYRVTYRQKIIHDSVRYILKSTQQWGKPLESAEYTVRVHPPFEIQSFTYQPDTLYYIQGEKIYYWKRKNFMPHDDFVLHYTLPE
jgi:hypothetical protein